LALTFFFITLGIKLGKNTLDKSIKTMKLKNSTNIKIETIAEPIPTALISFTPSD